ncbi:MAG: hypothetical protein U9R19_16735 [Bacteroidota bacterium]|nr:hypothetical protein [Bacteroidota bacterium]
MTEQIEKKPGKSINILYISVIVVLVVVIGIISYLYKTQIDETEIKIAEVVKTTREKAEVKAELSAMYIQYDSVQTDNDSLNFIRNTQKDKIKDLLKNLNNKKFEIHTFKKEIKTMRNIMKSYIVQIDSLNTRNQILIAENKDVKAKFRKEKSAKEKLMTEAQQLEHQIENASVLKAKEIIVEPLKKRGRKTKSAKRVEKIKICFQLPDNTIAQSGDKEIYVRIARPDELVLTESKDKLFLFEGKEIVYSAMRIVEYNNLTVNNACIYYDNYEELIAGTYNVDIFSDGQIIGQSTFILK